MNFQTLIATKAARVCRAAKGRPVAEFGLRRAQGLGGVWASRAAVVGGCASTSNVLAMPQSVSPASSSMRRAIFESHDRSPESMRMPANVLAGKLFNIPVSGTHAHSWVMSFDDELTAAGRGVQRGQIGDVLLAEAERLHQVGQLRHAAGHRVAPKGASPRPGQKSSGLRAEQGSASRGEGAKADGGASKPRRRRRSRKPKADGGAGAGSDTRSKPRPSSAADSFVERRRLRGGAAGAGDAA